jgi:hypothetical protein
MVAIYSENNVKLIYVLCGQNTELVTVKIWYLSDHSKAVVLCPNGHPVSGVTTGWRVWQNAKGPGPVGPQPRNL